MDALVTFEAQTKEVRDSIQDEETKRKFDRLITTIHEILTSLVHRQLEASQNL